MDLETFKIHNYNDNIINQLIENNIDIDYCCKKNLISLRVYLISGV